MMELQTFTAEREWTVDGIPVLSATIALPEPVLMQDKFSRRIHRYYQLQCRAYLQYCEKHLFPSAEQEYRTALISSAPLPMFRAELNYQITYHDSHFLSLYTQSSETGPHQHLKLRRGDTWDLSSGYPVPLSDFFPDRSPWKRQLIKLASEEIQKQERTGLSRYHENWKKMLRRHFNSQNYYLTKNGLAFFFPMYAIAPAEEGIPTFLLPYGKDGSSFYVPAPDHSEPEKSARSQTGAP